MWENEHKKRIIRNCTILLALLLVAGGLVYGMVLMSGKIAAEDKLLLQQHNDQRQEMNVVREGNLEAVQVAYTEDLETVQEYLPGVVCWGDSLTAGSSGNISYPLTLQKYINAYLCDIYDPRYSVENPESYSRLETENYKISIPVINMGSGQENCATILGRAGVVPYQVRGGFTIPAETESVMVSIGSRNEKTVNPLTAGNAGVNPVTIAGVEGTLTRVASGGAYSYQFTRLTPGSEVLVEAGTEILTASREEYKDYIHIVWIGSYETYISPNDLVENTKALISRQTKNTDRYLVIGLCTYGKSWSGQDKNTLDAYDSAMLQAFGNRYINLRKYLIEDGLRDAKISATKDDTLNMNQGQVPKSFQSNASGADLNGVAYQLLGKLVYDRMDLLGYFNEIRSGLKLDRITQDILKDNSQYFENALKR